MDWFLSFFPDNVDKDCESNVLVKQSTWTFGVWLGLTSTSWLIFSQSPPDIHNKWKTLMPWKLAFLDNLLPKPAKNFPHYKTNGAERQIAIMIYNDTCASVLGRTSPLARRMVGDALLLSPQATIWSTNLGSTCNRKLKSHFSIVPIFILIKEREFLFCFHYVITLCPHATSTQYIFDFIELNSKDSLYLIGKNGKP